MATVLSRHGGGEPEIIAGRYVIEGAIAKGGMGAVYRAYDRQLGRKVALKRLINTGDERRRTRMFEREFHTLVGLRHPRIIEVYDYGIDARGAYYTMELLDGHDLRELAPLPYRTACRYLRDVASSLALLHARNLLHRDLSPRNVRITSNDRAKLLDFGTLAGFGRSLTVVGTAPGIPPETLYGTLLDQRADLYSLGALAYWMVTGRHAYDVRAVDELPEAWSKPLVVPSLLVPRAPGFDELPSELEELIAALLSKNPLARPFNAAEVIARLSALAQLPADDEPLSALSYLHGGKTVGRARERAKLRRRAKGALAGVGSVVTIEAEAGMGSSRLIADLAIETRMLGATAIVVDASMQRGAYGVVDEIARALFAALPERALAAMGEHAATLARFLPGSDARGSATGRISALRGVDPRESRTRLQMALLAWFERLARDHPLVLAVHRLHRADESSAAFLSALSHGIATRRMLLVLAYDPEEVRAAPMLAGLKNAGAQLVLRGLNREEVHALVVAAFGEVASSERLAAWLYELTSGKPQACLDLIEHLIERDVILFLEGVWVLPQELSAAELPADIGAALDARLSRLSPEAHKLALALCVHRGPAPLERCIAIAAVERIAEPLKALSELEQRGVIGVSADEVTFVHAAVRDAALRRLAEAERKRLHAEFGRLLAREEGGDRETMLEAGWHLLHGGEDRRGADLLAELGVELAQEADYIPAALPALEAALQTYRRLGRPAHERARLLAAITTAGLFVDRKVIDRYGDESVRVIQEVLGLSIAQRLSPLLGGRIAIGVGLGVAFVRLLFRLGPRGARRRLLELITLSVTVAASTTGLATLTLDVPRARQYAALLDPLRALGADQAPAFVADYLQVLAMLPEDRIVETIAGYQKILARFERREPIRNINAERMQLFLVNALYALGVLESFRESPEALRIADRLEAFGFKLCELFANQIRANYHGLRGEIARTEEYRERVETIALQAGSGWLAEIWSPTSAILHYQLSRDAVGIRRVIGELDRLAAEIPSLRRHALLAHATYQLVRGDYTMWHEIGADLIVKAAPRSFIGWAPTVAAYVRSLARLGDPERALRFGLEALARFDAEDRKVTTMITPLIVELAMVEAELGQLDAAATRLDDYLAEIGDGGGPVTRGSLHEARAFVALQAEDAECARAQLLDVQRCFLPTDNPTLIARCERLSREIEAGHSLLPTARDTVDLGQPSPDHVRAQLRRFPEPQQRSNRALELLLDQTGSPAGYLFNYEHGELQLSAQLAADAPGEALKAQVLRAIGRFAAEAEASARTQRASEASETSTASAPGDDDAMHRVLLFSVGGRGGPVVVAAAALETKRRGLRMPGRAFIAAIAAALDESTSTPSSSAPAMPHTDSAGLRKPPGVS